MSGGETGGLARTQILAVDDNAANLLAIGAVLQSLDVEVLEARSGEEALKHVMTGSESIAVILLDVHMPGLDGFETADLIRARESLSHLPIIFVTAVRREEAHIVKGYAHGAVDYVVKPFDPDALRTKVAYFVAAHQRAIAKERDRRAIEQRLALAVEAGRLGMWSWDASTRAIVGDDRCRALLGSEDGSLDPLEFGLPPLDSLAEGTTARGEYRSQSGNWLLAQARVFGSDSDRRVLGIVADISAAKQNQLERELFVGVLGHDLRSPLSVISMQASLLADHQEPAITAAANRISRSVKRIDSLIQDMLDFVGSRSGALLLSRRPANLDDICQDVIDEVASAYPNTAIVFEAGNPSGGVWDVGRLSQVIQNLLRNAVRHNDSRAPISVAIHETGEFVALDVTNNGESIPPEMQARIFEPFVSGAGGTGLGLNICQRLVDAHGGRISVSCDNGRTTFRVLVPRRPPSEPTRA